MWISPVLGVGYFILKNHQNRLIKEINRYFFHRQFRCFRSTKKNRPKKSTTSFRICFDEKSFAQHFGGYLFRSQISPRFQKSHLENCAMRPGTQIPVIYDPAPFFFSIPNRSGSHLPYRLDMQISPFSKTCSLRITHGSPSVDMRFA